MTPGQQFRFIRKAAGLWEDIPEGRGRKRKRQPKISLSDFRVLVAVADADSGSGCFKSVATLAEEWGMAPQSVKRSLANLTRLGVLTKEHRGERRPPAYTLNESYLNMDHVDTNMVQRGTNMVQREPLTEPINEPTNGEDVSEPDPQRFDLIPEDAGDALDPLSLTRLYNRLCPSLVTANPPYPAREKRLLTLLVEHPEPSWWTAFFERCEASDWLAQRVKVNGCGNLGWIIKPSNLAKIEEGHFDNRGQPSAKQRNRATKAANLMDWASQ